METRRLAIVGQSQAAGSTAPNPVVTPNKLVAVTRGPSSWVAGTGDWIAATYGVNLIVNNIAQSSTGVSPLITDISDTYVDNWSPTYGGAGDNYWKARVLGSVGTYARPLATFDPTHIEICFGTNDAAVNNGDGYATDLAAFTDALLVQFPTVKLMVHHVPSPSDGGAYDNTHAQYLAYLAANVDGVQVFAGADFYTRMINKDTVPAYGPLLDGAVTSYVHFTEEGYRWAAIEVIRAYLLSGWFG